MRACLASPRSLARWGLVGPLLTLAAMAAWSSGAQAGGTPEYVGSDYTVGPGETRVLENRTLVISGNILVEAGGTIELRNSTLLLNLSVNGSRTLRVEAGGTLRALDLDGSGQTAGDRSLVGSSDPARRYTAHFPAGANVLFRGSAISGFGYSLVAPGLLIQSDNVTFEEASLEAYVYLRVEGASPRFEGTFFSGDGTGTNRFYGSSSALRNCTLSRHFVALSANDGSSLELAGALVRDSVFSFAVNGSSLRVTGAIVNNSSSGVYLTNGSIAVFTDVQFDPAAVFVDDVASSLSSLRTFTFWVRNGAAEGVRNATVTVRDGSAALVAAGNTGASGTFGPIALRAFAINATQRTDDANYTVTATKLAENTSSAFSALVEPTPVALLVLSNIDPRLELLSPSSGAVLLAGVAELFAVNASDPDGTAGGVLVSWRSSRQGPLGSGASIPVALVEGWHTIEVEARDQADGYRLVTFNVTVEAGRLETVSTRDGGLWYNASVWKTSRGSLGITPYDRAGAPLLSVGKAVLLHATSGVIVWEWAILELSYDNASLPHGTSEANLTALRWPAGAGSGEPGLPVAAVVDTARHVVVLNISRAEGLGSFLLLAHKGLNVAPLITEPPTLSAVVGLPFAFTVEAVDTPGDAFTFALVGGPPWLSLDADTGLLSGTPLVSDRGLALVTVSCTDEFGAIAAGPIRVFVSGTTENRPPQLVNPRISPTAPVDGDRVRLEVTFFDADGDLPLFIEAVVDGTAHAMDAAVLMDINTTDGKAYAFEQAFSAGLHNISFRTSDGAPGHADTVAEGPALAVVTEPLRALNNWFLALLASVAATLALYLYVRSRAPAKAAKAPRETPEERATFLQGAALKPIPPQPPIVRKSVDPEEALAREAEESAKDAARSEASAAGKLAPKNDKR